MGLAGRKEKQRIGSDPRNLAWAEDNSRFGQQYLAKFGWTPDSGAGLGANGDGRLKHISVAQKLNLLGIRNNHNNGGPDAIAWKQNHDFESVLKKLNGVDVTGGDIAFQEAKIEPALLRGFVRPEITDEKVSLELPMEDAEESQQEKKRRKKEKKAKTSFNERREERLEERPDPPMLEIEAEQLSNPSPVINPGSHLAHRAKFRKSKQMASLSTAALNEILGISAFTTPSTSNTVSQLASPGSVTPQDAGTQTFQEPNKSPIIEENLTTSSTSVANYFAAKLKERRLQLSTPLQEGDTITAEPSIPITDTNVSGQVDDSPKKKKKRKREENVDEVGPRVEGTLEPQGEVDGSPSPAVEKKKEKKKRKEKESRALDEESIPDKQKKKRSKDRVLL